MYDGKLDWHAAAGVQRHLRIAEQYIANVARAHLNKLSGFVGPFQLRSALSEGHPLGQQFRGEFKRINLVQQSDIGLAITIDIVGGSLPALCRADRLGASRPDTRRRRRNHRTTDGASEERELPDRRHGRARHVQARVRQLLRGTARRPGARCLQAARVHERDGRAIFGLC